MNSAKLNLEIVFQYIAEQKEKKMKKNCDSFLAQNFFSRALYWNFENVQNISSNLVYEYDIPVFWHSRLFIKREDDARAYAISRLACQPSHLCHPILPFASPSYFLCLLGCFICRGQKKKIEDTFRYRHWCVCARVCVCTHLSMLKFIFRN